MVRSLASAAGATVLQAIANSGMGSLYLPGSDKGKGWVDTRVKPELFTDGPKVGKIATEFNQAANELAKGSALSDTGAFGSARHGANVGLQVEYWWK
mgnify:CR=1 FL=1